MLSEMERRGNECYRYEMSDPMHAGGCLCGAVRFRASGAARNLCYCHCVSCRRAAGSPGVPWGTFERARFEVTHGALTQYRSSAHVLRGFCSACGTCLSYYNELRPTEMDVTLACLDDAERFVPAMHVWVADKLPWVVLADDLPKYPGGVGP